MKHGTSHDLFALAIWPLVVIQLGLALYIGNFGPTGPLPMHFDFAGHVDRWGTRQEAALAMAGTAFLSLFLLVLMKANHVERSSRGNRLTMIVAYVCVVLVQIWLTALLAALGLGRLDEGGDLAFTPAQWGLVLLHGTGAALGAVIGKTTPNQLAGVRNRWTAASRLAWDKANRLFGRWLFLCSLFGLLTLAFIPEPAAFGLAVALPMLACAAGTLESWRVWRVDPDRVC